MLTNQHSHVDPKENMCPSLRLCKHEHPLQHTATEICTYAEAEHTTCAALYSKQWYAKMIGKRVLHLRRRLQPASAAVTKSMLGIGQQTTWRIMGSRVHTDQPHKSRSTDIQAQNLNNRLVQSITLGTCQ